MKYSAVLFVVIFLFACHLFSCKADVAQCRRAAMPGNYSGKAVEVDDDDFSKKAEENLRVILRSIANGDKRRLASLCIYPISRKYPLHDIENAGQMEAYFDVMFDKPFRNRVAGFLDKDSFDMMGWRGDCIGNGEMWIYDSLYAVNYSSPEERRLLKTQVRMEMESLDNDLRGNEWQPYSCYKDCSDTSIIRIDVKGKDRTVYRLAGYVKGQKSYDKPAVLMYGTVSFNGSMNYRFHEFANNQGDTISFGDIIYDANADSTIEMKWKHGRMEEHHWIKKCYWLDELVYTSR